MQAFRRVLGTPGLLALAVASVASRMQSGMAAIALVLYLQHETGSFAAAGAAAAAYAIGIGATGPLLGRIVDRRGRGLLVPAAALSSLATAAVVVLGSAGAPAAALVAAAGVAGLAAPPVGGVTRQRLAEMVAPADVPTAFALDSIMLEALFISGPLLAGLLAATAGPATGLLVSAVLGTLGTVWFAFLVPPDLHHSVARREGSWLAILASPTIRFLVLSGIPIGATLGALDVALPAFGVAHGNAALGGPFGAAIAVGSAIGGIVYGTEPRRFGTPVVAFVRLTSLQLLLTAPLLGAPSVAAMLVLATVSGCFLAPLVSVRSELVRSAMGAAAGAEAFTWISATLPFGAAVGSAVAGPAVEGGGWRLGVGVACFSALCGVVIALTRRGGLGEA